MYSKCDNWFHFCLLVSECELQEGQEESSRLVYVTGKQESQKVWGWRGKLCLAPSNISWGWAGNRSKTSHVSPGSYILAIIRAFPLPALSAFSSSSLWLLVRNSTFPAPTTTGRKEKVLICKDLQWDTVIVQRRKLSLPASSHLRRL